MKKIIQTLVIIFLVSLMSQIINIYRINEQGNIGQTFGMFYTNHTSFEYGGDLRDLDFEQYMGLIYEVSDVYGATIIVQDFKDEIDEFNFYVYTSKPLDTLFNITVPNLIFDFDNDRILSSTSGTTKENQIKFLSKDITVNILPLNLMTEPLIINTVDIYHEDSKTIEEIKSYITLQITEENAVFIEYNSGEYDVGEEISMKFTDTITVTLIVFCVALMFFISSSLKSISIYKLQGYSSVSIMKNILLFDLWYSLVAGIFLSMVYFYVSVGFINADSIPVIQSFFKFTLYFVLVLVLLLVLMNVIIRVMSLSTLLKGNNQNRYLATAIYVLKIVTLLLLLPTLKSDVIELVDMRSLISYHEFNSTVLSRTKYSPSFIYSIRNVEYFFFERAHNTDNAEYLKQQELLSALQEVGAYYMGRSIYFDGTHEFDFLEVDVNYLEYIPQFKEMVENSMEHNDVVFLVDEDLDDASLDFSYLMVDQRHEVIYVDLPEHIYNYQDKPLNAIAVHALDSNRINKTLFNNVYYTDIETAELESIADAYGYGGMIYFRDTVPYVRYRDILMEKIVSVMLGLLLILTVSFAFFVTYIRSNRQKIAIKKLHGYNFLGIYFDYLLEVLLIYLILFFIFGNENLSMYLLPMGLEVILLVYIYVSYKLNSLSNELKRGVTDEKNN